MNLAGGHDIVVSMASGCRDTDVRVSENDTRSACVLDGELCLAVLSGDTTCHQTSARVLDVSRERLTDGTRQVVSMESLDVFDLERIKV